jgi:hypothetical protein
MLLRCVAVIDVVRANNAKTLICRGQSADARSHAPARTVDQKSDGMGVSHGCGGRNLKNFLSRDFSQTTDEDTTILRRTFRPNICASVSDTLTLKGGHANGRNARRRLARKAGKKARRK